MKSLLLCALILTGCAAPQNPSSSESIAQQKQQALAHREKQKEQENRDLRVAVRRAYVQDHPELSAEISQAILQEKLRIGMTASEVVATYSLWEYTTDPNSARYRQAGVLALWTLSDRRQTPAKPGQEWWWLTRKKEARQLHFENGKLTGWKDGLKGDL